MYIPSQVKEDRVPVRQEAICRAGPATLVTLGVVGLTTSHVPMLLSPDPAPFGTLWSHISKGNAQWREAAFFRPRGTPC